MNICKKITEEAAYLGLSIKNVRSQGEGVSSADIFRTRGVLQIRTSALFGAKTLDFLNLCLHGQGGRRLSQCGHFSVKGEGSIFRDFMRASFNGRPLTTILCLITMGRRVEKYYLILCTSFFCLFVRRIFSIYK